MIGMSSEYLRWLERWRTVSPSEFVSDSHSSKNEFQSIHLWKKTNWSSSKMTPPIKKWGYQPMRKQLSALWRSSQLRASVRNRIRRFRQINHSELAPGIPFSLHGKLPIRYFSEGFLYSRLGDATAEQIEQFKEYLPACLALSDIEVQTFFWESVDVPQSGGSRQKRSAEFMRRLEDK